MWVLLGFLILVTVGGAIVAVAADEKDGDPFD